MGHKVGRVSITRKPFFHQKFTYVGSHALIQAYISSLHFIFFLFFMAIHNHPMHPSHPCPCLGVLSISIPSPRPLVFSLNLKPFLPRFTQTLISSSMLLNKHTLHITEALQPAQTPLAPHPTLLVAPKRRERTDLQMRVDPY